MVDSEGFPRADIDVHSIRTQRNRFAKLKTDHKEILAEIEKHLHIALAPPSDANHNLQITDPPQPTNVSIFTPAQQPQLSFDSALVTNANGLPDRPQELRRPAFALVDIVSEHSPAASAGLQVNDRVVAFGAVSLGAFPSPQTTMAALPGLLREHENQQVDVVVERGEGDSLTVLTLSFTPRRWSGQGLLGCHVVPLEINQVDDRYQPEVATAVMNHSLPDNV